MPDESRKSESVQAPADSADSTKKLPLPESGILATEIVDELEAALAQFAKIAARLKTKT